LGNPLQEEWIDTYSRESGVRLAVAVGAFLDFEAGTVQRAPHWMNDLGVEWCYRLWQEPERLWRRYVIGNPKFLTRVVRERLLQVLARQTRHDAD
jgi:N-acetylglucosaminyldiphosphoundecaprenol N-acetyl-beta-D-mannosaminyltransferase